MYECVLMAVVARIGDVACAVAFTVRFYGYVAFQERFNARGFTPWLAPGEKARLRDNIRTFEYLLN